MAESSIKILLEKGKSSIIKVIGVGGAGNNALKHMYEKGIHGVDFIICNTDEQALVANPVEHKIRLGAKITEGLGAGANPEVGEKAAVESIDEIKAALGEETKMVFITAGMGGGTGTGAAPVVAKIAKDMGILTVGIVTVPFTFEGKTRLKQAEIGLEKLRANVDSLIVINNDKLRHQHGSLSFKQGFAKADEVLTNAAKGMAEVITASFSINIDFRDAKSVLQNSGTALMSTGIASGENRAEEAIKKALDSPLLNDNKITGAKDILLLILSGTEEEHEAKMDEIGLINDYLQDEAGGDYNANIIFGVGTEPDLGEALKVLVIATGFKKEHEKSIQIGEPQVKKVTLYDTPASTEKKHSAKPSPFMTRAEREANEDRIDTSKKIVWNLSDEATEEKEEDFSFNFNGKTSFQTPSSYEEKSREIHLTLEDEKKSFQIEDEQDYIFIKKETNAPRTEELKNKLDAFNASNSHNFVPESDDFDKIPAYKRKNIALDLNSGADFQNRNFISENEEGEIQIKENKFFRRDVD